MQMQASTRLLVTLTAAYTLSSANKNALGILTSSIQASLRLSDLQVSLAQGAAFAISYVTVGLIVGRLSDRGRTRRVLLIGGILVWSLATLLCAFSWSLSSLLAFRVLLGAGESVILPVALSTLVENTSYYKRGSSISIFLAGSYIGIGLITGLGGLALDGLRTVSSLIAFEPWRFVFVALALCGLPTAFFCARLEEVSGFKSATQHDQSLAPHSAEVGRPMAASWTLFFTIVASMTLCNLVEYAIEAWLPTILERRYDMTHARIGLWLGSVSVLLGGVGTAIGGWLSQWRVLAGIDGNRCRASAVLFAFCVPLACFGLVQAAILLVVTYAGFAFILNAAGSAALAAAQDVVPPHQRGFGTASQSLCFITIGLGLGPTMGALAPRLLGSVDIGVGLSTVAVPLMLIVSLIMIIAAVRTTPRGQLQLANAQQSVPGSKASLG